MVSPAKRKTMSRAHTMIAKRRLRITLAGSKKANCKTAQFNRYVTLGSLADDGARANAIDALIDASFRHKARYRQLLKAGVSSPRHYLFTQCVDDGLVVGKELTEAQIKRVIAKAYRAAREMKLHGIFALQIVGIRDTRNNEYTVWLHVHGIAYTYDQTFKPMVTARKLSKRRAYSNMLGAPSINLRSRKQTAKSFRAKNSKFYRFAFAALHRDQTRASLSHLAYYLLHPPEYMQKLVPSAHNPSKATLRSNSNDYPAWLALHIHELENQIPIETAIFSVGEGKRIRSAWKRAYSKLEIERSDKNREAE